MPDLLIGCGNSREKRVWVDRRDWVDLVAMDRDPDCGADVLHNLDETPWPFEDNTFDECHAYETLEHLGQQGDWQAFFRHFGEIWRVLKPGGHLLATVPDWRNEWAWGDPSHTRIITPGTLLFLSQKEYSARVGKGPMTDFRHTWDKDFDIEVSQADGSCHVFILRAVKD
jgi:SAM-dependent methyltransferase